MNTNIVLLLALALATLAANAQGPLSPPPGAPAPVMKSLDQIEARTPLVAGSPGVTINADGGFDIILPGSYYLTKNLAYQGSGYAIKISANNVSLDLNGFTISDTGNYAAAAISSTALQGLRICNGFIEGSTTESGGVFTEGGFEFGIVVLDASGSDIVVRDISVRGVQPTSGHAINLPKSTAKNSIVERCNVSISSAGGIIAGIVRNCTVSRCGTYGIDCLVGSDSSGHAFGGAGVRGDTLINCEGNSTAGIGISAQYSASNCVGISSSSVGLSAGNADNCRGSSYSAVGLNAGVATNSQGLTTSGSAGLEASGTASFCRGSRPGGTALSAPIAIGCTSAAGVIVSVQKHLGTP